MNTDLKKQQLVVKKPRVAPKWKNLWFTKDGKSYLGVVIYDTIENAEKGAQEQIRDADMDTVGGYEVIFHDGQGKNKWFWKDYSWHMQIPIIG